MNKFDFRDFELKDMLNNLKEFLLPKGDKKALVVTLGYSAALYLPEEINGEYEISERVKMEIMFYNPYNYCKVACRIDDGDFILVADHDSCWREGVDRCVEMAYETLDSDFTKECDRVLGKDYEKIVRDILLSTNIHLNKSVGGISNGFKLIEEPEIEKLQDIYESPLKTNF